MLRFLLLGLCVAALGAGEAVTAMVPPALAAADTVHTAIYRERAAAVVGIVCRGTADGRTLDFYGTGVVVSSDGLILTNATVVPEDGHAIRVSLLDGRVLGARLVAFHAATEGALLRLDTAVAGLVHMPLGASRDCRPGDPAYSWGNPHLTIQRDGMVSLSVGRISGTVDVASVDDQSRYVGPVLEVDAAVNPGSDGGPITDCRGNVIGIMSLAFSPTRWLGLAIPIDELRAAMPELAALPSAPAAPAVEAAWPRERALQAAAPAVAAATVGVWAERSGDRLRAPVDRRVRPAAAPAPYGTGQERVRAEQRAPEGCASGLIIDPQGLVLTSAFVVADRSEGRRTRRVERIWIWLPDGARHAATVVARDERMDLALLRIERTGDARFPAVALAETPALRPGAAVAVLGRSEAPGGLTLNAGIVSAVERMDGLCLQISAFVNYGNQGGPVIDRAGRVVGLVAHLDEEAPWRQNSGVGFCIRTERILAALPALRAGKAQVAPPRPALGVRLDFDAAGAGARLTAIVDDGPAAAAGLRAGDVVTAWDDAPVADALALRERIRAATPGQRVRLVLAREGVPREVTVVVGTR